MKNSFIAGGVRLIELDFADIADANNAANWVDFEKNHDIVKILTPPPLTKTCKCCASAVMFLQIELWRSVFL